MSQDAISPRDPDSEPRAHTVAIAGATGFIGSALTEALRRDGHRVRRLVRGRADSTRDEFAWEPSLGALDDRALEGADAVVNVTGETVGKRWTARRKARIRESRVETTRLIAQKMAGLETPPRVLLNASGVGIYGDRGDEVLDENSTLANDFFGRLGQDWEGATAPAQERGVRVVRSRFGVVMAKRGGMLNELVPLFRLGLGVRLGSGKHWVSWIALSDLLQALRFLLFRSALAGPVNVLAPNPVTNAEFTRTLARVLRRPAIFTAPAFVLRIAFGELADAVLLASQRAVPRRLLEAGFVFRYPHLEDALRAEFDDSRKPASAA